MVNKWHNIFTKYNKVLKLSIIDTKKLIGL